MSSVFRAARERATMFAVKPSRSQMLKTFWRVFSLTPRLPVSARETEAYDTPASFAISLIVIRFSAIRTPKPRFR
jgi:hypothetical protein